jgi:hypothetical protein
MPRGWSGAAALVLLLAGWGLALSVAAGAPGAARPEPGAGAPPAGVTPAVAPFDTFAAERDSTMNAVLEHIAGREDAPAESVFKNVKLLKNVPAGRLVRIMNMAFGRSLGVRCAFCHTPRHWADEDKPQKQVAREMMALVDTINTGLLPKIRNLESKQPRVNCTTCHRGATKPALSL